MTNNDLIVHEGEIELAIELLRRHRAEHPAFEAVLSALVAGRSLLHEVRRLEEEVRSLRSWESRPQA